MRRLLQRPLAAALCAIILLSACGRGAPAAISTPFSATETAVPTPTVLPASPTPVTAPAAVPATATPGPSTGTSAVKLVTPTTAPPTPAPPTATPVPVLPQQLEIPAIGVKAPVEEVGLTPDGAMDVPKQWDDVGWYRYGPLPGDPGNAAIAGHLDSTTAPAVFWRLGALKPGDKIMVTRSDAKTITFVVTEKDSYAFDKAPIARIFGPASSSNLNLITCGGSWDAFTKNYSNRIVIYATRS